MTIRIVVASKNPVKKQSVQIAFNRLFSDQPFEFEGVDVPSGVSSQPMNSDETLQGALNRVNGAAHAAPNADYWVGIEGGVEAYGDDLFAFAWVVVRSGSRWGKSRTGSFALPPQVVELIHQGMEMGDADDVVFGRSNSKQQNGAIGLLTGDVVDRTAFYEQAVILALLPFKNPGLYPLID
jgi:inosine/xanthosine triphosphatase